MDPTITAALIAGPGALVIGGLAGHFTGRRSRAATLALTDAQTEDLETQIAERVVRLQEKEAASLNRRIEELQRQIDDLKQRYAERERELQRDLESTRGERDTLRAELAGVRTQLVAKEAELAAAKQEIANLHAVQLVQAAPGTTVTPTS